MRLHKYNWINLSMTLAIVGTLSLMAFTSRGSLVFSGPTNGLYVGVSCANDMFSADIAGITNNVPIPYNDELAVIYFCKTGFVNLLLPLNKEISIKFQMRDKDGKEVAKTPLGELWGSQIQNFPSKSDDDNSYQMTGWGAAPWEISKPMPSWPRLISPDKLFQIKGSGVYDLTLEVHLMKQRMLGTNNWTWDHIAIPPVTVKVEKP
jgi:hypothetical protein